MDKTLRNYTTFEEMKADEYRFWQSRPIHERVAAVSELTQEHYALRGVGPDVSRLPVLRVLVSRRIPNKKSKHENRGLRPMFQGKKGAGSRQGRPHKLSLRDKD